MEEHTVKAVTTAMQRHGVRRLVVISVVGAGNSAEQAGFWYRYLLAPVFLHGAILDKEAMEAEVQRSGLDFVIVRPPVLSNDPASGAAHVVPGPATVHSITRADLAQFIVAQLTSDQYLGQVVTVANS